MTLIAFHNSRDLKAEKLAQIAAHREADELIKGVGWENGKGCAIGCTLHSYDHGLYESELGIPVMLAHLEDAIFEELPNNDAKAWPEQFLNAIEPGSDLSLVGWKFLHWMLIELAKKDLKPSAKPVTLKAIDVIEPITQGFIRNCEAAKRVRQIAQRVAIITAGTPAHTTASAVGSVMITVETLGAVSSVGTAVKAASQIIDCRKFRDKLLELLKAAGKPHD